MAKVSDRNGLWFEKTHNRAIIPRRHTTGSVGYDVHCVETVILEPGQIQHVDTGLKIKNVPPGYFVQVVGRSGLTKYGITTEVGIIDPDYEGNLYVGLRNVQHDSKTTFCAGSRIAQLILLKYIIPDVYEYVGGNIIGQLSSTSSRGNHGFGSTGGVVKDLVYM